jgi:hypothetical protein
MSIIDVEAQLESILTELDVDAVPLADVPGWLSELDEIGRLVRTAMDLLAPRVAAWMALERRT